MADAGSRITKTAAVTGAGSGIGRAFCLALARRGYDLILIDRSPAATSDLAGKLAAEFPGTRVETCVADLTNPEELERAAGKVGECETLEMLVNGAGFGVCANFIETDFAKQKSMIDIHVIASARLCHAALRGMAARDSGSIINIGSISAFTRFPQAATYCASKMYMVAFTESLEVELRKMGVRNVKLQALCPGQTRTPFTDTEDMRGFDPSRIPPFLWMTPETLVELSLDRIEGKSGTYIPHLKNQLYVLAFGNRLVTPVLNFLRKRGILEMVLGVFRKRRS
jgi:hypothetical protein